MFRVLFFVLVVMSSVVFSQIEEKPKQNAIPKASEEVNEFGYVSVGNIRYFMDMFLSEILKNADVRGYIINYGKKIEIARREKVLRNHINLRTFDTKRITFIRGGNKKEFTTELWIVPKNAKPPTP